jgi:hypothetical protein
MNTARSQWIPAFAGMTARALKAPMGGGSRQDLAAESG